MMIEGLDLEKYREALDGIRYNKDLLAAATRRKDAAKIAEYSADLALYRSQYNQARAGNYTRNK